MTERFEALRGSVERLRAVVEGLDPDVLRTSAYPSEWTIADVLSHLGSGAQILERRMEDSLAGVDTPDDAAPAVWDLWNAKTPDAQAADAVEADRTLLDRLDGLGSEDRERFRFTIGR